MTPGSLVPLSLADTPLLGLPLTEVWFGIIFFTLAMFLTLDGFDFGVGALFALTDDHDLKGSMLAAIGPLWDGNEVWLIVFGGGLFAVFPAAYANLFSRHYLLMFAILGALIVRGISPEMYEQRHDEQWQRWWGIAFVVGSVATPFLIGMFAGNWLVGSESIVTLPAVVVGLVLVVMSVSLGAAFLGMRLPGGLSAEFERYGVLGDLAYLLLVVVALAYLYLMEPQFQSKLLSPVALALVVLTVVLVGAYVVFLRNRQYLYSFVAMAGQSFGLTVVVGYLLYPLIDPAANLAVEDAVVATLQMNLMTIVAIIFVPIVLFNFGILYSTFSGTVDPSESY